MTENKLSETPRTDAATGDHATFHGVQFVSADFARVLERTIATQSAEIARLREALEYIATLRKRADDSRGMVDDPYPKALNAAVTAACEALHEYRAALEEK